MLLAMMVVDCGGEGAELQAAFTADPTSGTTPLEVQFTGQSTGKISKWQWDFDNDGNTDSEEENPSHTYQSAGKYTVSLKVTGASGTAAETKADYVTVSVQPVDADGDGKITSNDALLLMAAAHQYYETKIKALIVKAGIDLDESGVISDPDAQQKLRNNLTVAEYEGLLQAIKEWGEMKAEVDATLREALQ
jgi:hypothetical protein